MPRAKSKADDLAFKAFSLLVDEVREMSDHNLEQAFSALEKRVGEDADPQNAAYEDCRFMHRGDAKTDRVPLMLVGLAMDYVRFNRVMGIE